MGASNDVNAGTDVGNGVSSDGRDHVEGEIPAVASALALPAALAEPADTDTPAAVALAAPEALAEPGDWDTPAAVAVALPEPAIPPTVFPCNQRHVALPAFRHQHIADDS